MLLFFGLAIGVLTGLCFNAGRTIYNGLKHLASLNPWAFGITYGLVITLVLGMFLVSRAPSMGIPPLFFTVAHYGLGVIVYIVLIVNSASLLLLLARLLNILPATAVKQAAVAVSALSLAIAAALSIYGGVNGAALQTNRYTVQLGSGSSTENAIQIALVSDLHLGYVMTETRLERIVAAINATNPDLVCLAGDIFDGDITALTNPEGLQALFHAIEAPYGVFACLGNHDAGPHYQEMLTFLQQAGVRLLADETVLVDNRFVLVGRKDSSPIGDQGAVRATVMALPPDNSLPVIVMDHQPGNIGNYGAETDLVLCGHSHRGQMFPFNLISKATYTVDYGYYAAPESGVQFIVSSGAGTWGPPFRVGSANEVVGITVFLPAQDNP